MSKSCCGRPNRAGSFLVAEVVRTWTRCREATLRSLTTSATRARTWWTRANPSHQNPRWAEPRLRCGLKYKVWLFRRTRFYFCNLQSLLLTRWSLATKLGLGNEETQTKLGLGHEGF